MSSPSKIVNEIFIFDIDGVLTSIQTHKLEDPRIIEFLINLLSKNEPVAFNTGRSLSWVKDEIVSVIEKHIGDKKKLNNLFIVGEKGGAILDFSQNGEEKIFIDSFINIPATIKNEIRDLIKKKFSNEVFYDETKLTMVTVQKSENITMDEFNNIHPLINVEIKQILDKYDKDKKIKFTPTTLDTDIENNHVGKDFAAGKILEWLDRKSYTANKFITFGDNIADLEMAKHIFDKGLNVEFVFVGKKEVNVNDYSFKVIITEEKYDKGTIEYLKKINA